MMYDNRIVQFVCFETLLDREAFLTRWAPFAMSFLDRGLERIVLAERDAAGDGFAFVSRNEWPRTDSTPLFAGSSQPMRAGAEWSRSKGVRSALRRAETRTQARDKAQTRSSRSRVSSLARWCWRRSSCAKWQSSVERAPDGRFSPAMQVRWAVDSTLSSRFVQRPTRPPEGSVTPSHPN
jgi:hypothetical protein